MTAPSDLSAAYRTAGETQAAQMVARAIDRPASEAMFNLAANAASRYSLGSYTWFLAVQGFMSGERAIWDVATPIPDDDNITITGPRRPRGGR